MNFQTFSQRVHKLGRSDFVAVQSLAKSVGGRDVLMLAIGTAPRDQKPAILLVGNVHGPHLAAAELALRVAEQLVARAEESAATLLDRVTFYVIPCPSPDAFDKCFDRPYFERAGNSRRTDDDRDFALAEDPPNDLDGDGWITMMRIEDQAGEFMSHPHDPRVLIKADKKKNERGKYRLLTEGIDDDKDELWNEDGGEGVSFNRNFTFKYPFFQKSAGPHQVSEPETRAVADFAFQHPNVALVFTFTPEDNLMHPWKAKDEPSRIKKVMLPADGPYQSLLAEKYRALHGGKGAPTPPAGEGSFSEWAYFHFGRWSLATRGWWIPQTASQRANSEEGKHEKKDADQTTKDTDQTTSDAEQRKEMKPQKVDKRGASEVNALLWFAQEKLDGFVDWTPVEHPDFPNHKVEVGGFKPFFRLNPPAAKLEEIATTHLSYLAEVASLLPRFRIESTKVESLGAGIYRITAVVLNEGYLPTMADMGRINRQMYPTQIELDLPENTTWIKGTRRSRVDRLEGNGGKSTSTWLVRIAAPIPASVRLSVFAPAVGRAETDLTLSAP